MLAGTEVIVAAIHPGCTESDMIVVGTMAYSEDGRHVLVADEQAIGMPVNVRWLRSAGKFDADRAARYRERYLAHFPGTLKD